MRGSAEQTPGLSGSHGFSVKSSNHPTYEGKEHWTISPPLFFLRNVPWTMQPRPLDGPAQLAGESKQSYNWKATQRSGPCTMSQWVRPSNGPPFAQSWKLSLFYTTPWTWSSANGKNWAEEREKVSQSLTSSCVAYFQIWTCTSLWLPKCLPTLLDIRSKRASREITMTWFVILACTKELRTWNSAWSTSPQWTRLSPSLNLEVAPTLPPLRKIVN